MDMELIRRWNARVKPNDTVYHLGDFCFKGDEGNFSSYRKQLQGNLVLFRGNHDSNNGSNTILTSSIIEAGGHLWYLSHSPNRVLEFNLHGHIHTQWKVRFEKGYILVNVGVDPWGFMPINISEILKEIAKCKRSGNLVDEDV